MLHNALLAANATLAHALLQFMLGVAVGLAIPWIALKAFTKMPPPRE